MILLLGGSVLLTVIFGAISVWQHYQILDKRKQFRDYQLKIDQYTIQLNRVKIDVEQLREQNASQLIELATLHERNRQGEEKIVLLNQTKAQLKMEFEVLANRIFEDKGQSLLEQNRRNLDTIMSPFKTQLNDFKMRIEMLHQNDSKERISLSHQLKSLHQLNQQMSVEAANLTHALKGNKKMQGDWGEMVLQRVLEQSGLQQGREYELQQAFKDDQDKWCRPDAIIHLPDEKDIIVDAKVSLNHYVTYCNQDDETAKKQALMQHIRAVKSHIVQLSEKRYEEIKQVCTLDFVFMFMSIEPAYLLAVQNDPTLFSEAFHHKILFVGPSTLLAALRIVETVWRHEDQNRNAAEIARQGGKLYEKFVGFIESLDEVGKHLNSARKAYDQARNRLVDGRGNLIRSCEKLQQLGAKKGKRTLSKHLVDVADE